MPVAALLALALLLPGLAEAQPLQCLVVGISDGDTLTARCGESGQYQQVKVRLSAIDAPESKQPFGQRSKQALSDLCYMTEATITPKNKDRYGRTVADVECRGKDVARNMVAGGWAWYYVKYGKGYEHLGGIEAEARAARRGAVGRAWCCGALGVAEGSGCGAFGSHIKRNSRFTNEMMDN